MSCDRCKGRKIKVSPLALLEDIILTIFLQCINPTPGPCDYCMKMKYQCQITAQRKHRPLYFTSDEQFQWMIAILQHFLPDINLELEGLKAIGAKLGIPGPAPTVSHQTPTRILPASLEGAYIQPGSSTPNHSEGMSERSPSPPSETDRDDDANVPERLLIMTDTNEAQSQQSTAPEFRITTTTVWS
jgi:hypothetical protein